MARSAQGDAFLDVTMRLRRGFQQTVSKATAGECFLVCYLREHEGRASPGTLAAASGRSTARIAAALNSLEAKGLVTRQTCGEDRRKVQVLLTPAGEAQADDLLEKLHSGAGTLMERLGPADAGELIRILNRLEQLQPGKE